jgi:hypothetical protein
MTTKIATYQDQSYRPDDVRQAPTLFDVDEEYDVECGLTCSDDEINAPQAPAVKDASYKPGTWPGEDEER